ncbi:MAG TPA: aminotransferase class III-fold pyridoxal phosphate-dependent enzyme [Deltaproteobacteria bacterium]|nr:aminotransferase class III-fold pyridoxal phosphate-dependent enzyme [Deltaproteobacteria bacterium]
MIVPYTFEKSLELFARAARVIPQGIPGHLTPVILVPGSYPYFVKKAKGCRFWDVDGNEFIDYMCAYGPMILGYANEKVDEAYRRQAESGACTTIATDLSVELAETVTKTIDCADWVMFAKNGADATSMAVTLARGYTRRDKIVLAEEGYHGTQPWAGTNSVGITQRDRADIVMVPWGDLDAFQAAIARHKGQVAGVMFTPYHHPVFADQKLPAPSFWPEMRRICDEHGIVLIIDDVRAGWRLDLKGSGHFFGIRPDLACYSKAMANGYAISALVGTERMRITASKAYFAGSFWCNAPEMAAAMACIGEMKAMDAPKVVRDLGEKLMKGLAERAGAHGLQLSITGPPAIPFMKFANETNFLRSQLFCGECARRGVFFHPHHNWFLSAAHTERDIAQSLDVADECFGIVEERFGG